MKTHEDNVFLRDLEPQMPYPYYASDIIIR